MLQLFRLVKKIITIVVMCLVNQHEMIYILERKTRVSQEGELITSRYLFPEFTANMNDDRKALFTRSPFFIETRYFQHECRAKPM